MIRQDDNYELEHVLDAEGNRCGREVSVYRTSLLQPDDYDWRDSVRMKERG